VSRYGYWVDLANHQFDEQSWVHALPVGKFEHPVYGPMDFTADRIQRFADSVKTKVRGIDLDIDYDHKDQTGKAAGWVRDADVRADGLYLQVDWTSPAAEALRNREYRYFSPEFDDEWTDGAGIKHTDVLFGGALTNRPFLKNLLPVNLSEITDPTPQGGQMDPEQIRLLLGLGKDATDDQVKAKIAELTAGPPAPTPPSDPPVPPVPAPTPTPEPVLAGAALSEVITKALAESPLAKQFAEMEKKLAAAESGRQLAETRDRLAGIVANQGGRQFVLPPSVVNAIAEGTTLAEPSAMAKKFVDAVEQFAKVGFVELGERGRMGGHGTEVSAQAELMKAVSATRTKYLSETGKELAVTDAIRMVCTANPDLYLAYREGSYSGREA
jgi:hypothetical protein